jgi:hypothetical protein
MLPAALVLLFAIACVDFARTPESKADAVAASGADSPGRRTVAPPRPGPGPRSPLWGVPIGPARGSGGQAR